MAGYYGFSMSNNAIQAYEDGEKPFSKWTKAAIFEAIAENSDIYNFNSGIIAELRKMPVKALKSLVLIKTSWHHTSSHFNRTDFYSVDFGKIENLTSEEIKNASDFATEESKEKEIEKPEMWECKFLEWSGTRKHPTATEYTEVGEIRGNWFFRKNGSKKSINANGFEKIRKTS